LPGARARHHHFADRAVHDVTERAWLKAFLDGWLARVPQAMSEAAE
jgi:GMP synthase (glutamine-hydrolysing)